MACWRSTSESGKAAEPVERWSGAPAFSAQPFHRSSVPPLQLHLRAQFHDTVRRNLEKLRRRARVARHQDEELLPPLRHPRETRVVGRSSGSRLPLAIGDDDPLTPEIERGVRRLRPDAEAARDLKNLRNVRVLHEAVTGGDPPEPVLELFDRHAIDLLDLRNL